MKQSISKKKRGKENLHPFLQLVGSSLLMEIVNSGLKPFNHRSAFVATSFLPRVKSIKIGQTEESDKCKVKSSRSLSEQPPQGRRVAF